MDGGKPRRKGDNGVDWHDVKGMGKSGKRPLLRGQG